jgi:hypothetical protein
VYDDDEGDVEVINIIRDTTDVTNLETWGRWIIVVPEPFEIVQQSGFANFGRQFGEYLQSACECDFQITLTSPTNDGNTRLDVRIVGEEGKANEFDTVSNNFLSYLSTNSVFAGYSVWEFIVRMTDASGNYVEVWSDESNGSPTGYVFIIH